MRHAPMFVASVLAAAVTACTQPSPTPPGSLSPSEAASGLLGQPLPVAEDLDLTPPRGDVTEVAPAFATPTPKPLPPPPQPPPATPSPSPTPRPVPFVIEGDVLFASGSSQLGPEAEPELRRVADQIRNKAPGATMEIVGHTDSRGTVAANERLSRDRAEAVRAWFLADGFASEKVTALGRGEAEFREQDTDGNGRFIEAAGARNRRVELFVTGVVGS